MSVTFCKSTDKDQIKWSHPGPIPVSFFQQQLYTFFSSLCHNLNWTIILNSCFHIGDTSYVLAEGIICISAMELLSSSNVIWKKRWGPEIKYSPAVLETQSACVPSLGWGQWITLHYAVRPLSPVWNMVTEGTWCLNEVKLLSCNAKCYHYCYRPLNTGKKWQQKVVDNLYLKVSIVVEEQVRTNIKGNGNTVLQKTCSNMFIPLTVSYVLNVDCNVP